jgi:hypothetical protein
VRLLKNQIKEIDMITQMTIISPRWLVRILVIRPMGAL